MIDIQFAVHIHAPDIRQKIRHPRILEAFDKLKFGEVMELTHDHDLKQLQYQFMIEREGIFTRKYLEDGPERWRVAIAKI